MRLAKIVVTLMRDAAKLSPFFPLRHVAAALGVNPLRVDIRGIGRVYFRPNSSDSSVIRQVFRDEEYDLSRFAHDRGIQAYYRSILESKQVPVLVDAGANIGAASLWFAKIFPQAVIVAIEPQSGNADLCRRNLGHLPNIKVVEAAVGATSGAVSLAEADAEAWAFRTQRSSGGDIRVVTIPEVVAAVPHGRLFAAKVDIEGFESDLFSENTGWFDELKFLFMEPHDWMLPGGQTNKSFRQLLARSDCDLLLSGENLLLVSNRDTV